MTFEVIQRIPGREGGSKALCLGGGSICADTLPELLGLGCSIAVLDRDPSCAVATSCYRAGSPEELWQGDRPSLLLGDAVKNAVEVLRRWKVDLLVPCIPGHAAGRLLMAWGAGRLQPRGSPHMLDELKGILAGQGSATMDPFSGTVIASLNTSDRSCPLGCDQEGPCPLTGSPRGLRMDMVLGEMFERLGIRALVVRPVRVGVFGAITAGHLEGMRALLDDLECVDAVALATSCSCHAIANTFRVC